MKTSKVVNITAEGIYNGEKVTFQIMPNRFGLYSLGKAGLKVIGSRTNDFSNKVDVETLEEVAEKLAETHNGKPSYHVWLYYDKPNRRPRRLYSPKTVTIHWEEE